MADGDIEKLIDQIVEITGVENRALHLQHLKVRRSSHDAVLPGSCLSLDL
jgi:hypothetical protein